MKFRKIEILALILIIVIQSLVFIPFAMNKSYTHIEEARALGHASGTVAEIQDNKDFYDTWHSGEYYADYLNIEGKDDATLTDIYNNQKSDSNPPLYYMILRGAMNVSVGNYSVWPGAIINMAAYAMISVFLYFITKRLFVGDKYGYIKATALTLLSAVTLGAISNVIYTGMFSLVTLVVISLAYLHIRMYEKGKSSALLLVLIGIVSFLGLVTSYYCLLYILPMYILFLTRYIRAKDKKSLMAYSFTVIGTIVVSIAVFPFALYNMFFGNLGGEIVGTLGIQSALIRTIVDYTQKINHFGFNNMLLAIAIIALVCIVVKMRKPYVEKEENEQTQHRKMIIKTLLIPAFAYFLGVVAVSQWTELKYIMPICAILFVLTMYGICKFVFDAFGKKVSAIIIALLVVAMAVYPVISKSTPESTYADKVELIEDIKGDYNVPAVYLMKTDDDRFLDDILLFTSLDNSYIAADFDILDKDADFNAILEGQDVSGGFLLFVNNGQADRHILDYVLLSTGFESYKTLSILNSGKVYYIGNGFETEEIEDNYHDEMYESTMPESTEVVTEE